LTPYSVSNSAELFASKLASQSLPKQLDHTPSGFLTLSTPCSPLSLTDLFHSESALGINPPRYLSLFGAVRSPERRSLHDVQQGTSGFNPSCNLPRLQGLAHQIKPARVLRVFHLYTLRYLHGFWLLQGLLASDADDYALRLYYQTRFTNRRSPHALLISTQSVHCSLQAHCRACASGFLRQRPQPHSLKRGATSMKFFTSSVLSSLQKRPECWAIVFPQECFAVTRST
jgi:hypothetical protein